MIVDVAQRFIYRLMVKQISDSLRDGFNFFNEV